MGKLCILCEKQLVENYKGYNRKFICAECIKKIFLEALDSRIIQGIVNIDKITDYEFEIFNDFEIELLNLLDD